MKNIKLWALLCTLSFFFASCTEPKSEWTNYYGYTNESVIGTYSFSNISTAFDGVEGIDRHSCPDAEVRIEALSSESGKLKFTINCPDEEYSETLEGIATPNEDDFMIRMSTGIQHYGGKIIAHNVTAYVMKNDKQQLRLHGYAAVNTYKEVDPGTGVVNYEPINGEYYYFDVIKN